MPARARRSPRRCTRCQSSQNRRQRPGATATESGRNGPHPAVRPPAGHAVRPPPRCAANHGAAHGAAAANHGAAVRAARGSMLPTVPGARPGAPGPGVAGSDSGAVSWPLAWITSGPASGPIWKDSGSGPGWRRPGWRAAGLQPPDQPQGRRPVNAWMTPGPGVAAEAREQIMQFTELADRLIDLHQPLDAGGSPPTRAAPSVAAGAACGAGPARRSASWPR